MFMKKPGSIFYHIIVFVVAQIIWFSLFGLWIYWYVNNYFLFNAVGDKLSPQTISGSTNIFALVSGLVLLVMLSISMSLIFIYLNRQMSINRLYDNFISNVTHELKSPLSSLQLYLETMRKRDISLDKQNEFYVLMLKDIKRLGRLINSILYMSSFETAKVAKKVSHDYHVYNADSVIRNVLNEILKEFDFSIKTVEIKGYLHCKCVVDINWLEIVFRNLINNAVKYSPRPPEINIRFSLGTKYFYIEFSDKGIGIAPRDQKKIFNKFQRIDNPISPNVKGTGLGLYWVKDIVEYHGGKISVYSEGVNTGSTFKIALPIYKTSKIRYINRLLRLSKDNKSVMET